MGSQGQAEAHGLAVWPSASSWTSLCLFPLL